MALITAATAMLMLLAIGGSAVLNTMTETAIAASHRDSIQTLYAAEAAIDLAISRLRTTADWTTVAPAQGGATIVQGTMADLLQVAAVDPRVSVMASVFRDPNGDPDVLIVQAVASGPAGARRRIQLTIRRAPATESAPTRRIEMLSWRER